MTLRDFFTPSPIDGLVDAEIVGIAVAAIAVLGFAVYGALHLLGFA